MSDDAHAARAMQAAVMAASSLDVEMRFIGFVLFEKFAIADWSKGFWDNIPGNDAFAIHS